MKGILAKKIGMTRIFIDSGSLVPVTVLQPYENQIVRIKNQEKDEYDALVVGFKKVKLERLSKPKQGVFKDDCFDKSGYRVLKEIPVEASELETFKVGDSLGLDLFAEKGRVDVFAITKGQGFQGVVKRHGYAGGRSSHGHRMGRNPGSIGMCTYPGRVLPGKKLPGHHGSTRACIQNLEIVKIDEEKGLIMVKGPVPGFRNGDVEVRLAVKS